MNFKVGDRFYFYRNNTDSDTIKVGFKGVMDVINKTFIEHEEYAFGYDEIKPIKTCYAILGEKEMSYKVGDIVVSGSFKNIINVIDIIEDRLVIDTGIKTTPDSKNTMAMALPMNMFRLATPKEIEQGFRDE